MKTAWQLTLLVLCTCALSLADPRSPDAIYLEVVQPLFKYQCLGCHGEGNTFAKLDLRTRDSALQGGERGAALRPGDPDSSLLVKVIEHAPQSPAMPPGGAEKKLSAETIDAVRSWIEGGAPFNSGEAAENWNFEEQDLWAFLPLAKVEPPTEGIDAAHVRTPVDSFVLAKLNAASLATGPQADRRNLLRRVTYDLTGLPPTPEDVEAFVTDNSPDAYKKVVEGLLASPRYGERWGRHWLDVTRYADTSGYSNDFERPNAWRYRDYVIRSFNRDKPYDRFILEQIAGDELWPDDAEAAIATGFLRTGPWEHTGMSVAAVTRQLFLDDVTHHIGQSFLGLTLACARCHDHKFDPIPTRDVYRIQAIFAPTAFARRPVDFLPEESEAGFDEGRERFEKMIAALEQRIEDLHEGARARLAEERGEEFARQASSGVLQRRLTKEEAEELKLCRKRVSMFKESIRRFDPLAMTVSNGLVEDWDDIGPVGGGSYLDKGDYIAAKTHILVGGDIQAPGDEVTPGVLEAVQRYSGYPAPTMPDTATGRRAALALWIAHPDNPLAARVMVNRIWQGHFGRAIAANTNNFGKMGAKPTHPDLLDWLARFFIDQGWSVKAVHRVILYSEAYQRSTDHPDADLLNEKDPNNELLARFSPRRLEAEELRDSMLAVAGELSDLAGGPGTYPQINREVATQPRHAMGSLQPVYYAEPTKRLRNRRSIYSFQQRSLIDPLIEVFNGANPDLTCERRDSSTVPTQAFTLINSEMSNDLALALAARVSAEADSTDDRIRRAFELAYGRLPSEQELTLAQAHVEKMQAHHAANPAPPRPEPQPIIHTITSELTGEKSEFVQPPPVVDYEQNLHPSEVGPETRALADVALALLNSNEFVYVY